MISILIFSIGGYFIIRSIEPAKEDYVSARQSCSAQQPSHEGLGGSSNAVIRKLAEYEKLCKGAVVDRLMLFTAMPYSEDEALTFAKDFAKQLAEMARFDVEPLVVFEPNALSPTGLQDVDKTTYKNIITRYYRTLEAEGVSEEQMGTWVLFPEANTPIWRLTDAQLFKRNVTTVASAQKDVFPASEVSIMLNGVSYPDNDTSWSKGEVTSLLPYVTGLEPGLIDSVGLQGFPHVGPKSNNRDVVLPDPERFLPVDFAAEIAQDLDVSNIWLNTGTFKRTHTDSPAAEVSLTSEQRQSLLRGITSQADRLKSQSFSVSINIFAEDKSLSSENTDWSYWQPDNVMTSPDGKVLDMFIRTLRDKDIGFSLYDN